MKIALFLPLLGMGSKYLQDLDDFDFGIGLSWNDPLPEHVEDIDDSNRVKRARFAPVHRTTPVFRDLRTQVSKNVPWKVIEAAYENVLTNPGANAEDLYATQSLTPQYAKEFLFHVHRILAYRKIDARFVDSVVADLNVHDVGFPNIASSVDRTRHATHHGDFSRSIAHMTFFFTYCVRLVENILVNYCTEKGLVEMDDYTHVPVYILPMDVWMRALEEEGQKFFVHAPRPHASPHW